MNIVWAYHTDDVPDNGNFAQHTSQTRGGMEYTFIQDTNGGGGDEGDGNGDGGDGNGDGGDGNGDGGDGNGDGGDGNGDGGNGSSSMYIPSILSIMALFLFQRVMGA